jgi:hypothetical protein
MILSSGGEIARTGRSPERPPAGSDEPVSVEVKSQFFENFAPEGIMAEALRRYEKCLEEARRWQRCPEYRCCILRYYTASPGSSVCLEIPRPILFEPKRKWECRVREFRISLWKECAQDQVQSFLGTDVCK